MNYIIATYSGKLPFSRPAIFDPENILQKHLTHLTNIFDLKKEKGLVNKVQNVIIVCPPVDKIKMYPNYYQSDKWLTIFKEKYPHINLYFIKYEGKNLDHSYDQWIQGYLFKPSLEYNLLIEDDYTVNNINFDTELISIYNQKFKDNIGYLCTLYSDPTGRLFKHASISNGLVSNLTFQKVASKRDILIYYYNVKEGLPQLRFSMMFLNRCIPIDDLQGGYNLYFYHSDRRIVSNLLGREVDKNMFIPIQCFEIFKRY